jgi:sugar lactone lactonase YvrE
MSNRACALVLLTVAVASWPTDVTAQPAATSAYRVVEGHFKLPDGRKMGSTAAIALDNDGSSVWVFERCGANDCVASPQVAPVLKFDASGQLVKSFGAGMFVRPHGIHIDRDGNVWVTDGEGPDGKNPARDGRGHQVFKFSSEGKLLMTLGKPGVVDGPDAVAQPSTVYVAGDGVHSRPRRHAVSGRDCRRHEGQRLQLADRGPGDAEVRQAVGGVTVQHF